MNQTGTVLFVLKLIKNGISEILDNGTGHGCHGIMGCNGCRCSVPSMSSTLLPGDGIGQARSNARGSGKVNGVRIFQSLNDTVNSLSSELDLKLDVQLMYWSFSLHFTTIF